MSLSAPSCAPDKGGFQLDFSSVLGCPLDFRITANLNAVIPEPTIEALMLLAAAGAARSRR